MVERKKVKKQKITAATLVKQFVTLHAKRGLIQISRYGYFHGPGREIVKNYWNVSEISLSRREKFTATVKYFTP